MTVSPLLDAAGRRRSPATLPGYLAGRPPRNKGLRYPADPPPVEEIVAIMRQAGDSVHGARLRGVIVVLWRAGLRIGEALSLAEVDLDERRASLLVRHGKGGKRREVGMDRWGWEQLRPWIAYRGRMPGRAPVDTLAGVWNAGVMGGRSAPHAVVCVGAELAPAFRKRHAQHAREGSAVPACVAGGIGAPAARRARRLNPAVRAPQPHSRFSRA
jgi:integrase